MGENNFKLQSKNIVVVEDNYIAYYPNSIDEKSKHINIDDIVSIYNEVGELTVILRYKKKDKIKKLKLDFDNIEECDNFYLYLENNSLSNKIYNKSEERLTRIEALKSPICGVFYLFISVFLIYGAIFLVNSNIEQNGSARVPVVFIGVMKFLEWLGIEKVVIICGVIFLLILIYGIVRVINPPMSRRIDIG